MKGQDYSQNMTLPSITDAAIVILTLEKHAGGVWITELVERLAVRHSNIPVSLVSVDADILGGSTSNGGI